MKIGISCYPVYGGSGVVATELGIALARRGHEVHFITYAQPFRLPYFMERVYYHEVEVPNYPLFEHPPYNLALSVAIQNVVEQHDLDLLHAHYAVPHATSAWIAKEMLNRPGFRIATTLHGTDITLVGQDPSFQSLTQFSIRKSDGLTAVSEFLRRETHEHFDIPTHDIEVIPNFVDLEKYSRGAYPCHRAKLAREGEKIVTHISNFRGVKRVDDVVRVFARISRAVPARLLLVGDGPDRLKVHELAESEGVSDRVLFLGKQNSVAELLSCTDLFLLPSETEAFGLVALEAMACGVPVVATSTGGLPEVVDDGMSGFLRPVGDVDGVGVERCDVGRDRAGGGRFGCDGGAEVERGVVHDVAHLMDALVGDTLASALLANGIHLMGRSFKYHRPRGVLSAGSDEHLPHPAQQVKYHRPDDRGTGAPAQTITGERRRRRWEGNRHAADLSRRFRRAADTVPGGRPSGHRLCRVPRGPSRGGGPDRRH